MIGLHHRIVAGGWLGLRGQHRGRDGAEDQSEYENTFHKDMTSRRARPGAGHSSSPSTPQVQAGLVGDELSDDTSGCALESREPIGRLAGAALAFHANPAFDPGTSRARVTATMSRCPGAIT
ncbi:MAG: hypothetical protein DMF87_09565 [Acidobacteria bacterium]|nr:MAG: hypothetical protein DMF87_09565 [Acidobacteriota bacterium]